MRTTHLLMLATLGLVATLFTTAASADSIALGEQDFNDGDIVLGSPYNAAQAGEVVPFGNSTSGSDFFGTFFSASWTYNYAASVVSSASLTIGLYDHDSSASGDQMGTFTVDGIDFSSEINALMNASGGGNNQYNVYTLPLTGAVLAALADGSATISMAFSGPGFTTIETSGNGGHVDFATLDFMSTLPEPSTAMLLGLGLVSIAARRRVNA